MHQRGQPLRFLGPELSILDRDEWGVFKSNEPLAVCSTIVGAGLGLRRRFFS